MTLKGSRKSEYRRAVTGTAVSGREEAREAVNKARRAVRHMDRAFALMAEDDPVQPSIKHVYAALCEAEIRAATLEDWYERTYGLSVER